MPTKSPIVEKPAPAPVDETLPQPRFYRENSWLVYAWSYGADGSLADYPPITMWFSPELTIEQVRDAVQERLDKLAMTSKRHVTYARYVGSLEQMQGWLRDKETK